MADEATTTSQLGQSVAEQTGNSYSDLPSTSVGDVPQYTQYDATGTKQTLQDTAQVNSGLNYVDQDKSTVQGQLKSLLSSDSDYIKEAEAAGTRTAANRGLLNSSMAAGASRSAAIQAALPIAQQDAQTYAAAQNAQQAAEYNQNQIQSEAIVSSGLSVQNKTNETIQQNTQNAFESAMQSASEQNKVLIQDMQNSHETFLNQMQNEQQSYLQTMQLSSDRANLATEQSSTIMQNYQISVENLLSDPDFLNLGADAVQNAVTQLQNLARNSVKFVGAAAGAGDDFYTYVDDYLSDVTIDIGNQTATTT